jgi:hypothetical protein
MKNNHRLRHFFSAARLKGSVRFFRTITLFAFATITCFVAAQPVPSPEAVRVTISLNADGSRTTYQFDDANHKATATITNREGKSLGKTHYTLDDSGRFATGIVYGPDRQLRFKSTYKYDDAGRLTQELQCDKDDAVLHKIVYAYDSLGKQTGYSIYDGAGRLVSQTTAPSISAAPSKKKKR